MGKPIVISVLGDTRDLVSKLGDSEGRLGKLGGVAKGAGLAVGAGMAAGAAAVVAFGGASIKAASDAEQSIGATETVFGKFSDKVIEKSNKAATAVGLSADEYRNNANLIGSLFKNQGVAADQLSAKTDKMIGLGADLAATFGGPTSAAVEALGSAFKGEFDPLEKYGISIKQSTINAELAARGQDKLTGAALKAAQQQATSDLIMRQSKDSLGAFGRENDTAAHQAQVLGAQWENLKAKAGAGLLPVVTKLGQFATNTLLPAIDKLVPPVRDLALTIGQNLTPVIDQVGAKVTEFAPKAISMAQTIAAGVLPIITSFAAFITTQVVPAVVRITTQVGTKLQPALAALTDVVVNDILPAFRQAQPTMQKVAVIVLNITGKVLTLAATILGKVLPPLLRLTGFFLGKLIPAAAQVVLAVVRIINVAVTVGSKIAAAGAAVGKFATTVISAIAGLPGKIKGAVTKLYSIGSDLIQGMLNGIKDKAGDLLSTIRQYVIDKIPGPIRKALGIHSPSRVFRGIGQNLIAGLVLGVRDEAPTLERTMDLLGANLSTFGATSRPVTIAPVAASSVAGVAPLNITLEVPVGASGADIGRELVGYLEDYFKAGGRRP